ncbi:type II secretion system protein [Moritella marina]|uniref:type II secretion system protein n=1 Tax=Moritella marina TaxID=90736 RepID=UPI003704BAE9
MPNTTHSKKRDTQHNGFTLIELVIVIVVLGILAATAIPKFINLRHDSRAATLESIKGTMESALQLVRARAQMENQTSGNGEIEINGVKVPLYNGYPSVDGRDTFPELNAQVKAWIEIDSVDRNTAFGDRNAANFFTDRARRYNQIFIFFMTDYDSKGVNFQCQIRYENSALVAAPTIRVLTDSC